MPAPSTTVRYIPSGIAVMWQLTRSPQPHMAFLFVSTGVCSPTAFTACLTAHQLVAQLTLRGFNPRAQGTYTLWKNLL